MKHCVWIFLVLTTSIYSQTPGNGVTDIDGNQYNSVIIGTQEWQKENLNVSKYTDGTIIPEVTDPTTWASLTTGAWCYYNNDPANGAIYGKLYNWFAVAGIWNEVSKTDASQRKKLAPEGFHVPTDVEWNTLFNFLEGVSVAGNKIKESGTSHWTNPNAGADNSTGFTALPGGARYNDGGFSAPTIPLGGNGFYWSSTEDNITMSYDLMLSYFNGYASLVPHSKGSGESVRCIYNIALNNQSFNSNSFNIYPNPTKDQFTIDCGITTNVNGWSYKIVNTLGQEVINGQISSQQNIVQLNNIKGQGVYFVKMYDSSNNLMDTKKIIIQK